MSTLTTSGLQIRAADISDAEDCGRTFFDSFAALAAAHSFPIEPGSPEFTRWRAGAMLDDPGFFALVAERDGRVVGSIFADERGPVVGIGPVAVDPDSQDAGIGRRMMEEVLRRERERGAATIRLVQTAYHYRSLALYVKLGFTLREPLSVLQGACAAAAPSGTGVEPATTADVADCDALCVRVHGHDRSVELQDAVAEGTARVVRRGGAITGYCTGIGYGWHAVGATAEDIQALIASADEIRGLGVIVPSRDAALLGWCLDSGLRIVQQSHLMTLGLYNEPDGSYLPSILF